MTSVPTQTEAPKTGSILRNQAFDGLRGFAILVLMTSHFGGHKIFPGAWLGINFFLVFSGFIIIFLMMTEQANTGRVDIVRFYRRRAKRLLPGLFVLLTAIALWGIFFAESHVRRDMKGDILATLGYVMNWRLILTSDDYFAQGGIPSLLRHAWTLAVEEQFYLVAPFFVIAVLKLVHKRWKRIALMIIFASASAAWAAHIGSSTPAALSHSYYGTDTRAQAIFIGIAIAFLLGPDRNGKLPKFRVTRLLMLAAWAAVVWNVWLYTWVEPTDPWVFEKWGIFWISVSALPVFIVLSDSRPNSMKRAFTNKPLILLGLMTYGLYLWHWPLQIWLNIYFPALSGFTMFLVGVPLTFIVAFISFRWLEAPIILKGLDAFTGNKKRSRLLITGSLTTIVALAFVAGSVKATIPALNPDIPSYVEGPTKNVVIFGDSSGKFFFDEKPEGKYDDLEITNLAVPGCDIVRIKIKWTDEVSRAPEKVCLDARESLQADIKKADPDVFVLMSGGVLSLDHILDDGRVVDVTSPEYRTLVESELHDIFEAARNAGASDLRLVTVPCRENDLNNVEIFGVDIAPYFRAHPEKGYRVTDPTIVNSWLREWAEANDVGVVDVYQAIGCEAGYQRKLNGITLYRDWFHFSEDASAMIWTWMAPELQSRK